VDSELAPNGWAIETEAAPNGWVRDTEYVASPYFVQATECRLAFSTPYSGPVLVTLDGLQRRRLAVDLDGTPGVGFLTDAPLTGEDLFFLAPGSGVVVMLDDGTLGRMRLDNDGALVAEPVVLTGWLVDIDATGSVITDVIVMDVGGGVVLPTADGLHMYRIRLDIDGAFTSTLVS